MEIPLARADVQQIRETSLTSEDIAVETFEPEEIEFEGGRIRREVLKAIIF
jgi:hypothetical protein